MNTFPLESITLKEAMKKQFKVVDIITKYFTGEEILTRGDLGVVKGLNKPRTTEKVEKVIAEYFGVEKAVLVRGSGTAAIKWGVYSILKGVPVEERIVLVHKAPVYPTTKVTFEMMGIKTIEADFNNLEELKEVVLNQNIKMALVQYTRQKIDDSYSMEEVISVIKNRDIPIVTDDNYAVMKVSKIGVELGADLSAFSTFKLLGPEGIGCVLGKEAYVKKIVESNYSGGGQVQGHEALDVIQGLVYAPVSLAIQAEVNEEVCERLNKGELDFVKKAYLVNAQSKVTVVELNEEIAVKVIEVANELGALPNPVGAESKYEYVPLFYRVSGTFRSADASLEKRMIRINPNRGGADTIIRILKESYLKVKEVK
ncbi:MAG: aminotransferase class V-fold PLP-dependent enzyme [Fusobacteriaceae bacterium]